MDTPSNRSILRSGLGSFQPLQVSSCMFHLESSNLIRPLQSWRRHCPIYPFKTSKLVTTNSVLSLNSYGLPTTPSPYIYSTLCVSHQGLKQYLNAGPSQTKKSMSTCAASCGGARSSPTHLSQHSVKEISFLGDGNCDHHARVGETVIKRG